MTVVGAGEHRRGAWRAFARGWAVFALAVVGNTALQTLLVHVDPTPELTAPYLLAVLGSLLVSSATLAVIIARAIAAVDDTAFRPRVRLVVGCLVAVILVSAAGSLSAPAGIVLAASAAFWLSAIGRAVSLRDTAADLRAVPLRTVGWILAAAALVLLGWLTGAVATLLLGGITGTAVVWIVWTVLAIVIACSAAATARDGREARRQRSSVNYAGRLTE